MFELDVDLPAELVPLSWLIGVWEGSGVVAYKVGDEVRYAAPNGKELMVVVTKVESL